MILWLGNQMITSGLFMSIIYCLLHMGMRLGQRGILNRRAGRRRPRVLEFGVKKKCSVTELSVNFHPCHHPRGSNFCGVCGFCSGVQPTVVTSWCPPQELQLPAPSSFCSADSSVWRLPCGGSWTKGPSISCPGHQTSWSDGGLISDFRQAERIQDQHEDVIQEDGS